MQKRSDTRKQIESLLLALWLLGFSCGSGFCQIIVPRELNSEQRVSWSHLQWSDRALPSKDAQAVFLHLHTAIQLPNKKYDYVQWIVMSGTNPWIIRQEGGTETFLAITSDQVTSISDGSYLNVERRTAWSFVLDRDHIDGNQLLTDYKRDPQVAIVLESILPKLIGEGPCEYQYYPSVGVVRLRTESDILIRISERTPNDTLQFGTSLSALQADQKGHLSVCCVVVNPGGLYLNPKHLETDFELRTVEELPVIPLDLSSAVSDRCNAFWTALARGQENKTQPGKPAYHPLLIFVNVMNRTRDVKYRLAAFRDARSTIAKLMHAAFGGDLLTTELPIDDMPLRAFFLEKQLTPTMVENLMGPIFKEYIATPSMPLSSQLACVDLVVDMGDTQDYDRIPDAIEGTENDLLFQAILFARHRRPWTPEHVAVCLKHLPDMPAGSGGELALVKTLVLMDEIAQVPADRVEHWYKSQIADGSRFEQLDGLRQLTLMPTARAWLRHRIKNDLRDPAEVKILGCSALRQRAEATLQTKQWDFMSEAECQETLTLLTELEPQLKQPETNFQ